MIKIDSIAIVLWLCSSIVFSRIHAESISEGRSDDAVVSLSRFDREPWSFQVVTRKDGPRIDFLGGNLSVGSPLLCTSPDWKTAYYSMQRSSVSVVRSSAPGENWLQIASGGDDLGSFQLRSMRVEAIGPRSVLLSVDGMLRDNVSAMIEYIPLCIPASLLAGAAIEMGNRRVTMGADLCEVNDAAGAMRFITRAGVISLTVLEGDGLTIQDRRSRQYRDRSLVLVKPKTRPVSKGERYRHVLKIEVDPLFTGSGAYRLKRLPVGGSAKPVEASDVAIEPVSAVAKSGLDLFPRPRMIRLENDGVARVSAPACVDISGSDMGDLASVVRVFVDSLDVAEPGAGRRVRVAAPGWIRLVRIQDPIAGRWDYHRLSIRPDGVEIAAVSPAAAGYALDTLAQLIGMGPLPCGEIEDWADFRYRSLHVMANDRDALLVQSAVIRRIMVPLRFNQIVLECKYAHWPSQPGIHVPEGLPYGDLAALGVFAEDRMIEVVPYLNSYGHCEYLFSNGSNVDIAEDPDNPYAYDVSNPKTYEVMSGLLSDVRAAFPRARRFHLGHDEVTYRGRYPHRAANKGRSLGDLLQADIRFYESWAERQGGGLMLWSDYLSGRLHRGADRDSLQSVSVSPSTVVVMWDYRTKDRYEECEGLLGRGLTVFGATGEDDVENVLTFSRYGKRLGLSGMMHTTWTGYRDSLRSVYKWSNRLWPYVQAGGSFWCSDTEKIDRSARTRGRILYDRMVSDIYPEVYRVKASDRVVSRDILGVANCELMESGGFQAGVLRTPSGGGFSLSPAVGGGIRVVSIADGGILRLPVGRRLRAVSFLWACSAWSPSSAANEAEEKIGEWGVQGDHPRRFSLCLRRQIGGLWNGQMSLRDQLLTSRSVGDQIFSIAQPVVPKSGNFVFWEYVHGLDGSAVDAVEIVSQPGSELVLAGVSFVE